MDVQRTDLDLFDLAVATALGDNTVDDQIDDLEKMRV